MAKQYKVTAEQKRKLRTTSGDVKKSLDLFVSLWISGDYDQAVGGYKIYNSLIGQLESYMNMLIGWQENGVKEAPYVR